METTVSVNSASVSAMITRRCGCVEDHGVLATTEMSLSTRIARWLRPYPRLIKRCSSPRGCASPLRRGWSQELNRG